MLVEPDMPGDGAGDRVVYEAACKFESELDLAVMVAFVPDEVLEEEDWVVIVNVHGAARFEFALCGVADDFAAVVQHLRDAIRVMLGGPFFRREFVS